MPEQAEFRRASVADDSRLEFLARIATMYYEQGMTQQEISEALQYSRSAISRYLTEARDRGVIEIKINHPIVRVPELEAQFRRRFGLAEALILKRGAADYPNLLAKLGALGADLVERLVRDNHTIALSWGTAVNAVAKALNPPHLPGVRVVQMIGSLGTNDPHIDGPELAQRVARLYGGRYLTLPAPLIVENPAIRDALLDEPRMQQVLQAAREAQLAVVGIGGIDPSVSSLVRSGYLSARQVAAIEEQGAVGDVCVIHFDVEGNILDIPIARRTVGIDLDSVRSIPTVIGVAGGEAKARAILGALRARLVNVLVVDDVTASVALEESGKKRS
jgi:deoxyribonucleoside regulator